jgi:ABC-type multidrug transport system permease subunit
LGLFTRAHLLEFFREPGILFWAFAFPILLSWTLSLAFLAPRQPGTILVVSPKDSAAVRARLTDSAIVLKTLDSSEALRALRRGEAAGSVRPCGDKICLEIDSSSQEGVLARLLVEKTSMGAIDSKVEVQPPRAKAGSYADFLFPGMLALGLMNGCIWGVGFALMDLRLRKLLRLFAATPLSRLDILLSVVLARATILPMENGLLWGFGALVFGVQIHGNPLLFLLGAVCAVVAFAGIGILGASRVEQTQAAYGIINALTIPMTIVSGIFFAWTRFPEWLQPFVAVLPLTLAADVLRAVSSEGAGLAHIAPRLLGLLAWGVGCGALGLRLFKWR